MNQGRTVFSQVVELLPRRAFENAVERYRGDRRVRALSCTDQLLCMIFAQLTGRSSLRETVTCLEALGPRRYHCGIRGRVAHSTLAEANEKRDYRILMDTALAMIAAAPRAAGGPGGRGAGRRRLRVGLDHDRPVPEAVPLGAFPPPQGRDQGPHAAGPAGGNPRVFAGHARQDPRLVGVGPVHPAGRGVLRGGQGVRGLRPPAPRPLCRGVFHHPGQEEHGLPRLAGA